MSLMFVWSERALRLSTCQQQLSRLYVSKQQIMQNVRNLSFSYGIPEKRRFSTTIYVLRRKLHFRSESLNRSEAPEIEVFRRNRCKSGRKRRKSKFSREIVANHAKSLKSSLFFRNRKTKTISATIYGLRRKLNFRSGVAKSERRVWNRSAQAESLQIGQKTSKIKLLGKIAWNKPTNT